MGTGPAITSFDGKMFIAFKANNSSNTLWFTSSADGGVTYAYPGHNDTNITLGAAPALAVFNNVIYLAFLPENGSGDICITTTTDGINFTPVVNSGIRSLSTPALQVFNSSLNVIYEAPALSNQNPDTQQLGWTYVTTGNNLAGPTIFTQFNLGGAPGVTVFNNKVYATYQSNDSTHTLNITTAPMPTKLNITPEFSQPTAYPGIEMGSAPSAVVYSNALYLAFKSNDGFNRLWVVGSLDGVNFTNPGTDYTGCTMNGSTGPVLAVYSTDGLYNWSTNGDLYLALLSNDGFHQLWTLYATPIIGQE